jgi:hypothetical protein
MRHFRESDEIGGDNRQLVALCEKISAHDCFDLVVEFPLLYVPSTQGTRSVRCRYCGLCYDYFNALLTSPHHHLLQTDKSRVARLIAVTTATSVVAIQSVIRGPRSGAIASQASGLHEKHVITRGCRVSPIPQINILIGQHHG